MFSKGSLYLKIDTLFLLIKPLPMTKLTQKYKKIMPDESIALIKDTETNKRYWRHRFMAKRSISSHARQAYKDYRYSKFKSMEEFRAFIEDLPKDKRYKE